MVAALPVALVDATKQFLAPQGCSCSPLCGGHAHSPPSGDSAGAMPTSAVATKKQYRVLNALLYWSSLCTTWLVYMT